MRRLRQRIYRAPGERDDCPACRSTAVVELDVLPLRAARTGFVSACESCGLVFSNPLPTPRDLETFYSPSGTWAADRHDQPKPAADRLVRPGRTWTRMFEPIRSEVNVKSPPPGVRVLDYGCGDGKLLDLFRVCGWETYGIEPAVDTAFPRHARLEAVPDTPTFDMILVVQVLEHVPNPLQLLRDLGRACRPGGHLLVAVPRFDTLPIHRDYRYVLNGRAHITAYTWTGLRTLLARTGWEPVAPPPAEIGKGGGGRRTTSRLRVLARRVEGAIPVPERPADEARAAIRAYYARADSRPLLARLGLLRLAARAEDRERRRLKAARKAAAGQSQPRPPVREAETEEHVAR